MTPRASTQLAPSRLSIIQGVDGTPTLVFDGPDYFDVLSTYPTFEAALEALKRAEIVFQKLEMVR